MTSRGTLPVVGRGFAWRGRMGVEPTGAGSTDAHTVLKTGEATGPHPPPRYRELVASRWVRGESSTCDPVPKLPLPLPRCGDMIAVSC